MKMPPTMGERIGLVIVALVCLLFLFTSAFIIFRQVNNMVRLASHGMAVEAVVEAVPGVRVRDRRYKGFTLNRDFILHYDGHTKSVESALPWVDGMTLHLVYLPEDPYIVVMSDEKISFGSQFIRNFGLISMELLLLLFSAVGIGICIWGLREGSVRRRTISQPAKKPSV